MPIRCFKRSYARPSSDRDTVDSAGTEKISVANAAVELADAVKTADAPGRSERRTSIAVRDCEFVFRTAWGRKKVKYLAPHPTGQDQRADIEGMLMAIILGNAEFGPRPDVEPRRNAISVKTEIEEAEGMKPKFGRVFQCEVDRNHL